MNELQRNTSRAWVEINLDAVEHNVREIKKVLKPGVKMMGVVKADAYGHGATETAKVLIESGVDELAVAFADEAIQLRRAGIDVPVLILGETPPERCEDLVSYDITACVYDYDMAKALSDEACRQNKTAKIHIKTDTGMSRIGFVFDDNGETRSKTVDEILKIHGLPALDMEGIFTHFSSSDEEEDSYTRMQFRRFTELAETLKGKGVDIPVKHISNSAAIIDYPEMQLDMVRAGVILYGMYPSESVSREKVRLIPVMTFKARVINVKEREKDVCVSYGRTYKTSGVTKIATVAVGYADGFSRVLSGKALMLINGKKVKQIGRICMDQCMIDVSDVNNISVGDEVILFGGDEQKNIPVELVAGQMGTINYEIPCMISRRIPHIYIRAGKSISSLNYLLG